MYRNQMMPYPAQMGNQGIQYVGGLRSAVAYQMMPNQEVILMDQNEPVFYWKTTDAAGVATIREFEFKERIRKDPAKEELEDIKASIHRLEFMMQSMKEANYESTISAETSRATKPVGPVQEEPEWRPTSNSTRIVEERENVSTAVPTA